MSHRDEQLAGLVARDIERHLATAEVTGPAFAIALWIDEGAGSGDLTATYGLSIGVDADLAGMRSAPAYRDMPDEYWHQWPASERWNSGCWRHLVDRFLAPDTESAIEPLRELIRAEHEAERGDVECDLAWPCSCNGPGVRSWVEIGFRAVALTSVPAAFPTTADVLVFAEGADQTPWQRAVAMRRTVDSDKFHAMFPAWRRLAEAARSASEDDELLAELRLREERAIKGEPGARVPWFGETPPDEFTALMMACGLDWNAVSTSGKLLRIAQTVPD